MHENIMVYLVGFPGTGKLTVARELAPLLQAKIVDNHWINNPIFGLLDNDRTTPFPEGVWDQVAKVRQAVLDTIATLSAPAANFILTHAGFDADPEDRAVYDIIVKTAERRRSVFVPVRLLCEEAELVQRVISPERASRLKSMDPIAASRAVRRGEVLKIDHSNAITLDISSASPLESARRILRHIEACGPTAP
jgi:predicted kinase